MKKLLILLLALLVLVGCTPKTPTEQPEPPVTDVTPEPVPEPIALSYTIGETSRTSSWSGVEVEMRIPEFTGENQSAMDVLNQYYALLAGKVMDYAEGDLQPQDNTFYNVNAGYRVTRATENTVSVLWQVLTTTNAETLNENSQSAAVFHVKTGNLLTFADIFGENAGAAKAWFVEETQKFIQDTADRNYFYEQANFLAETAFDPNSIYFDETGVNVFYHRDALGSAVIVAMPYEIAANYLAIEP